MNAEDKEEDFCEIRKGGKRVRGCRLQCSSGGGHRKLSGCFGDARVELEFVQAGLWAEESRCWQWRARVRVQQVARKAWWGRGGGC